MSPTDLIKLDDESRQRALQPYSFIVEAPAGAGKTELLTQRYLKLLAGVNEPEEIIAITFTNKAAAEMRGRVLQSLQDAADCLPVTLPHKTTTRMLALEALARSNSLGWNLLAQPARLRINTIDSLCSLLARQMPLLSRLGGQPAISDDASMHYQEAARRTLATLEEAAEDSPVSEALRYFDNDSSKLAEQLANMLAKRDQWLQHATRHPVQQEAEQALNYLIRQDLQRAAELFSPRLQAQIMPLARYAAANLPVEDPLSLLAYWETPLPATLEALPLWRALCAWLLTGKDEWRKTLDRRNGFPADDEGRKRKQDLIELLAALPDPAPLARIRILPRPGHEDAEWRTIGHLANLLQQAAMHLVLVFKEAGEVDFVEVASRALLALGEDGDPTDLALRLDYQIQHLLVDEFQDTSPAQVRLLERLTAGWQAGDGRTLFCVGDPMQSIYRFRKAEVGLFLKVAESGIGHLPLERLHLYRNNRSCPAVVSWVNSTFSRVFPAQDDATRGSIRYRPFAATLASQPDDGVVIHPLVVTAGATADCVATLEATTIARLLTDLQSADPARSIAVLVRARSHLTALVTEIRQHHREIRFQAVEIEALAGRQVIQDLLALTQALLHRADRVHWLAILRAPWCGLTLADLHVLAADDHRATIWTLMNDTTRTSRMSQDGQVRLGHVRHVLSEVLANRGRQRLRRWIESAWLMLGGPQCLWETDDYNDVQALLDLIERLEARDRLSELSREAEKLYAAADTAVEGRLQFMTIHKSKGLEFDTVILPGLHRSNRGDDHPLVLWEEVPLAHGRTELAAAPHIPREKKQNSPSAYDYLRIMEKQRSENEDVRVLYVAATRAIRSLHLVGVARRDHSTEELKITSGTPLDLLWPSLSKDFAEAPVIPDAIETNFAAFTPSLIRLKHIPAGMSWSAIHPVSGATTTVHDTGSPSTTRERLDADVGTLAHRYAELIAAEGLSNWSSQRIASLEPAMQRWLQQRGHGASPALQGAARVIAALDRTLNSEDGRWVLASRPEAEAELAMDKIDGSRIRTHVVDRTFKENGERWIIDYKSTDLGRDASPVLLEREAMQHRDQLERYVGLFEEEALPVRMAVFFMMHGKLVEIRP